MSKSFTIEQTLNGYVITYSVPKAIDPQQFKELLNAGLLKAIPAWARSVVDVLDPDTVIKMLEPYLPKATVEKKLVFMSLPEATIWLEEEFFGRLHRNGSAD